MLKTGNHPLILSFNQAILAVKEEAVKVVQIQVWVRMPSKPVVYLVYFSEAVLLSPGEHYWLTWSQVLLS